VLCTQSKINAQFNRLQRFIHFAEKYESKGGDFTFFSANDYITGEECALPYIFKKKTVETAQMSLPAQMKFLNDNKYEIFSWLSMGYLADYTEFVFTFDECDLWPRFNVKDPEKRDDGRLLMVIQK
jgi:hypothetical protein